MSCSYLKNLPEELSQSKSKTPEFHNTSLQSPECVLEKRPGCGSVSRLQNRTTGENRKSDGVAMAGDSGNGERIVLSDLSIYHANCMLYRKKRTCIKIEAIFPLLLVDNNTIARLG